MISTKNIITNLDEIPRAWPFEYYLKLTERLSGQSVKIKSIFSGRDKVPSMCIYTDGKGIYKFKDFSSGYGGDNLDLVLHLFDLQNRGQAAMRLINDYNVYISNNVYVPVEQKFHAKFHVNDYEMRHWTTLDQMYWKSFKLGSNILEQHNVHPLSFYTMVKEDDGRILEEIRITKNFIYGYFREDGTLYKVYQPRTPDSKFVKVRDYIQGSDQLKFESKYLLITSSLKDLMCFKRLGISGIECIAPDSENTVIPENFMKPLVAKYQKVFVLFDNDEPGIRSAAKYKARYGFESVNLALSKDLSDSVKDHGVDRVREEVFMLLKQAL